MRKIASIGEIKTGRSNYEQGTIMIMCKESGSNLNIIITVNICDDDKVGNFSVYRYKKTG